MALNVQTHSGEDSRDENGVIKCGHCGKLRHGRKTCWALVGKPAGFQPRRFNENKYNNPNNTNRRCWICGRTDHLSFNCPQRDENINKGGGTTMNIQSQDEEEDEQGINNLFIGMMVHLCTKTKGYFKGRCNAEQVQNHRTCCEYEHENESWDKVNYHQDNNEESEAESNSEMSWCKLCEHRDNDETSHDSDSSTTSRNHKGGKELRRILGINDYKGNTLSVEARKLKELK